MFFFTERRGRANDSNIALVVAFLCYLSCKKQRRDIEGDEWRCGRSQNTVPIASTQVAIKGIVQYSTRAQFSVEQLATRHSREHTLSAVGPDVPVE